jgi:hypothetical protein
MEFSFFFLALGLVPKPTESLQTTLACEAHHEEAQFLLEQQKLNK